MKRGYARVSTDSQDLGKQIAALQVAGCDVIYQDTVSGAKASRPELNRMLAELAPGDTVVVHKLDRFARSVRHLHKVVGELQDRGIGFVSLQDSFDLTTSNGRLMFNLLAAFAEFERDIIRSRTSESLAHLKSIGRTLGRPTSARGDLALKLIRAGIGREQVIRESGISRDTYYRILRKVGAGVELPG